VSNSALSDRQRRSSRDILCGRWCGQQSSEVLCTVGLQYTSRILFMLYRANTDSCAWSTVNDSALCLCSNSIISICCGFVVDLSYSLLYSMLCSAANPQQIEAGVVRALLAVVVSSHHVTRQSTLGDYRWNDECQVTPARSPSNVLPPAARSVPPLIFVTSLNSTFRVIFPTSYMPYFRELCEFFCTTSRVLVEVMCSKTSISVSNSFYFFLQR